MALTVPSDLLEKAQHGPVTDDEFVACNRESLPYAGGMAERLAKEMDTSGAPSVQNLEVPRTTQSGERFFDSWEATRCVARCSVTWVCGWRSRTDAR